MCRSDASCGDSCASIAIALGRPGCQSDVSQEDSCASVAAEEFAASCAGVTPAAGTLAPRYRLQCQGFLRRGNASCGDYCASSFIATSWPPLPERRLSRGIWHLGIDWKFTALCAAVMPTAARTLAPRWRDPVDKVKACGAGRSRIVRTLAQCLALRGILRGLSRLGVS